MRGKYTNKNDNFALRCEKDMEKKDYLDLFGLQTRLKDTLEGVFPFSTWVRAEISSVKARYGSHCYLELSQSDENGLVAKVKAVIWAGKYKVIAPYFEEVTGSPLKEGMEVLLEVQVTYHQLYGLSLVVNDIDPEFTLGAKEDARQKTIRRLTEEGLMDLQKELALPALPYRIAVISAPDAAGYRDFMRHLHENEYGFVFHTELFPALMQGAGAPESIAEALHAASAAGTQAGTQAGVAGAAGTQAAAAGTQAGTQAGDSRQQPFDVIMILRGGGSVLDLACFDDYDLCAAIARCPVPVLTAVGHDQDYHVADMVASDFVKTPTALADRVLDLYCAEDESIAYYATRLKLAFSAKIQKMESAVDLLQTRIKSADPRAILSRGYTLALDGEGRVAKSAKAFPKGSTISIMFPDGTVKATVS